MKLTFLQRIPLALANFLFPYKFYGKENIIDGSAVIVSNHFSAIDCVHFLNISKERPYFLAKKELFEKKFLSWLFKKYGGIPVDRKNPDMRAMLSALKVLKNGEKLVIFPEGTRNKTKTNELQDIKGGAVVFAVRSKCPIIPVMLLNKPKLFKKTKIIIGKPFTLENFYDKKLGEQDILEMDNIVREKMIEQQKILIEKVKKKR